MAQGVRLSKYVQPCAGYELSTYHAARYVVVFSVLVLIAAHAAAADSIELKAGGKNKVDLNDLINQVQQEQNTELPTSWAQWNATNATTTTSPTVTTSNDFTVWNPNSTSGTQPNATNLTNSTNVTNATAENTPVANLSNATNGTLSGSKPKAAANTSRNLTNTTSSTAGNNTMTNLSEGSANDTLGNVTNTPTRTPQNTPNNVVLHDGSTMLETDTAVLSAQFAQGPVSWYVDGTLTQTSNASSDTLYWTPGITYTDQHEVALITATNGEQNQTYHISVVNVFNPFWEGTLGDASATVHVFSNNQVRSYTAMSVLIRSNAGSLREVPLFYDFSNDQETDWKAQISNLAPGNNYIDMIIVENNATGFYGEYPVNASLAHYTTETDTSARSRDGFKNQGSTVLKRAEDARKHNTPPELVVVTFSADVVTENDTVNITADLRDNEEVASAAAVLIDEHNQTYKVQLELTSGAIGYGTWTAQLSHNTAGKHTLVAIEMLDNLNTSATAPVENRAFYVTSDALTANESLRLVYGLLSKSTIMPGESLEVRMDAKDAHGIKSAVALLKSKDDEIRVPMNIIAGTAQYGTWSGPVVLNESDATYTLTSITLSNGEESREIRVYGQKVYVQYVKSAELIAQENAPEPDGLRKIIRNPVMPLAIGLGGMAVAMLIVSSMSFMRKEE
jgi:hypothetical protein